MNPDAIAEVDMVLVCFSTAANHCERQFVSRRKYIKTALKFINKQV